MAYKKYSEHLRNKINSSLFWTVNKKISDNDGVLEAGTDLYCKNIHIYFYDKQTNICRIDAGGVCIQISSNEFDSLFSPDQNMNDVYLEKQKKLKEKEKLGKAEYVLLWAVCIIFIILETIHDLIFSATVFRIIFLLIVLIWTALLMSFCLISYKTIPKIKEDLNKMEIYPEDKNCYPTTRGRVFFR